MNIKDQDKNKQRFNVRQRQVSLQPQVTQTPLGNAIPKHKITINENNRTNPQHIDQLNDSFSLDEESSTYGDNYIRKLAMNILDILNIFSIHPEAEGVKEAEKGEVKEEESKNKMEINQQIEKHILTGIVKDWKKNCKDFTNTTKDKYELKIRQFIEFLIHKGVSHPTREDAKEFLKYVIATENFHNQQLCIWSMDAFFHWTGTEGKYENIVDGLKISKYIKDNQDEYSSRLIDTIEVMKSEKQLRSALSAWIKTLSKSSPTRTRCRYEILNLILFFKTRGVGKPTYNDIMDYYNLGRTIENTAAKDEGLEIIHKFFYWSYKNNQYPEDILPK